MSLPPSCVESLCVRVSEVGHNKDSRAQAPIDTGDTALQTGCIRMGVRRGLAKSVTQAPLGTGESPTRETNSRCIERITLLGNVEVTRVVVGKRVARSHFVNALSNLRQQRLCPESLQAIGAMATICSVAGG